MEVKPRLHSFKMFAGVEPVRMALSYFGIDYEQVLVKCEDTDGKEGEKEWELKKHDYQFQDLPVLEIDGMTFSREMPILRYIFMRQGHYPTDPKWAYMVESLVDLYQELDEGLEEMLEIYDEKGESKAQAYFMTWAKDQLPRALNVLTKRLSQNGGSGYLVGNQFSMADLCFLNLRYTQLQPYNKKQSDKIDEVLGGYPALREYWEGQRPAVQKRLDNRPGYEF